MTAKSIAVQDLKIGETYTVKFDDCCVAGEFTSKLIRKESPDDEVELAFENGVTLERTWGCEFYQEV